MNAISNLDILVSCLLDAFVMLSGWADNATAKIFAPSAFGNRVKSSAAGLERSCQLFHTFQTSFVQNTSTSGFIHDTSTTYILHSISTTPYYQSTTVLSLPSHVHAAPYDH
ncbi:hypothetical protein KC344_g187 [Hortaea werneckii]|nr:hypothetical protein KC344_g187 [Hortaea werneckii]